MELDGAYDTAIAIIGRACRIPGANEIHDVWPTIVSGTRSIRDFTISEAEKAGLSRADGESADWVYAGAPIGGIECFDAAFFGYAPSDAAMMDPQHRLLLEHAWHAIEDAGYASDPMRGRIGVFAGSGPPAYKSHNLLTNAEKLAEAGELAISIGNDKDALCSTLSYKLGLEGPSVAVQTFCSTS
ncbi:beta-ketoacyl synthase N-terminal-like domain-containing protein, partial [Mesorhizobium sp. M0772]|uniref:beta-ketoacyl synthase N-terminal-like domain-containing protein n=1 Tax=Mesorhizobium sp. M0772 TaxID=2956998 RepID=UPI0033399DA5